MPDPATTPPLDDREKVTRVLHDEGCGPGNSIHGWRCEHADRYGPCDCVDELADTILAVLDLPARDRDTARAALTGYATEMEAWNLTASRTEARRVRHYRGTTYPPRRPPMPADDYTPDDAELRKFFVEGKSKRHYAMTWHDRFAAEFDRWLAAHDARVRADTITQEDTP